MPKGPSFDPDVKRLAVQVEDHPLDYAGFEGVIPAGNYGAGDVLIFDHGTWTTKADPHAQLKKGHLRFSLHGDKLVGAWDLVRTGADGGKPRWLLRKTADEAAGPFESDDLLGDPQDLPPLTAVWRSDRKQELGHQLASALTATRPHEFIEVMTKAKRGGKIFVDYLRNGRGATAVSSYSLRNNPGATVAMPITWAELAKVKGADVYDLRSALAHLAKRKRDPWAGIDELRQALPRAKRS